MFQFINTYWVPQMSEHTAMQHRVLTASLGPSECVKDIYFVIYGIISELTDKGQFQYLTNLKGPQEGTYLYTIQFLSLR